MSVACRTPVCLCGVAALVIVSLFAGCSSERFRLANRSDTTYERQLAADNVRVPVNPNIPERPALADRDPFVPPTPTAPAENLAANLPAQPTWPLPAGGAEPSPLNRPLLTETPRPGAEGTRLDLAQQGVELAGRVVSPTGQPAPRVGLQVVDPRQQDRVLAEVATDDLGMFRVRNLSSGEPYRLLAATAGPEGRLVGSIQATAPDMAVVVQLQMENAVAGRSPLGNRLGSQAPLNRATLGEPIQFAGGPASSPTVASGTIPGQVSVTTIRALNAGTSAAPALARVVPPTQSAVHAAPIVQTTPQVPVKAPVVAAEQPTQFAGQKEIEGLVLPSSDDLKLPDVPAQPAASTLDKSAPRSKGGLPSAALAFSGTGIELARVYDLDGNSKPVGALSGNLFLLDFFGTWCGPCRQSIPHLNALRDRFAAQGLQVIGIASEPGSIQDAVASAADAPKRLGIKYPVVATSLDAPCELRDYFKVKEFPTYVVIDRAGKIHFQASGGDPATLSRLEQAIEQAIASKVALRNR